ncbi:PREDICTED: uncharacterized protein LOC105570993, partial [Vollenhovia emeryi]|uniref:uncharacterized protein LOC105570993 n=1 Tax=Vollenhovia emeryi TaxID=411798 RepID=UPI0005F464F3
MQDLWILKCEWDTVLPVEIRLRWQEYCDSLVDLPRISISRWLGHSPEVSCQIHGFADASTRAYAAVVYLRLDNGKEQPRVCLLAAKTKVAPVKTISIPKLELSGASLLVKLICHLRTAKFLADVPVYAWSDSQIVLAWLRKHPSCWKTFTANRVSYIQTELPSASWSHVSTKENPADLATRGSLPSALAFNALWWHGPSWLTRSSDRWPLPSEIASVLHVHAQVKEPEMLGRFSSFTRLVRVIAYCRRPLVIARRKKGGADPLPPFLSTEELSEARIVVFRLAQSVAFESEIEALQRGERLRKRNPLNKLSPFLCKDGLLRVGGRLSHSELPAQRKNPPILPHKSALSLLLAQHAHRTCLHGGPTLTASLLMQQAWILGRSRLVKSVVYKCVVCQRVKPRTAQQLMGDLPASR